MSFFDKFFGKKNSADNAKERLQLVLIHDRTDLTPAELDSLRDDLIATISRHVDIDTASMQFGVEHDGDKHLYYNYNFNLPASAVIQGIQVRLDARADASNGAPKICVQLSWAGGTTWTTARSTPNLSTSETTYTLGSISDNWGRTWSPGNFNNANFRIRVINVASNMNRDFFLDYAAVNITYQP